MSGFVVSMMASPEPLYPKMMYPRTKIPIYRCPVGGITTKPAPQKLSGSDKQRYEQIAKEDLKALRNNFLGNKQYGKQNKTQPLEYYHLSDRFTKFAEIARYVVKRNKRTVVMVDDDSWPHFCRHTSFLYKQGRISNCD